MENIERYINAFWKSEIIIEQNIDPSICPGKAKKKIANINKNIRNKEK